MIGILILGGSTLNNPLQTLIISILTIGFLTNPTPINQINFTNENQTVSQETTEEKTNKKENSKNDNNENQKQKDPTNEGKSISVTATAYTAECAGCTGITKTGINLHENPDAKVIAVDPSVIPLDSKVYVEGYGYAIAGDTGGAIKGNKIDLYVLSETEAMNWGVRTVEITILD